MDLTTMGNTVMLKLGDSGHPPEYLQSNGSPALLEAINEPNGKIPQRLYLAKTSLLAAETQPTDFSDGKATLMKDWISHCQIQIY